MDRLEVVLFWHLNFAIPRDLTGGTFWIPASFTYSLLTTFLENYFEGALIRMSAPAITDGYSDKNVS